MIRSFKTRDALTHVRTRIFSPAILMNIDYAESGNEGASPEASK
jgi:hypothetical protein